MATNNKSLLIIFEPHMNARYQYIAKKFNMEIIFINLNNKVKSNILLDFYCKIKNKSNFKNKFLEVKAIIADLQVNNKIKIYVSNSEGYVAHNFLVYLKKEFPSIEIIAMQQGIMTLTYNKKKIFIRKSINNLCMKFFGIYPYGTGFGIKLSDKYIVYTKEYKKLLLELGWSEKDVIVDLNFLKSDLFDFYTKNKNNKSNDDIALFLPQCLSLANITTEKDEERLLRKTILYIAKKHKKVLIKNHPACKNIKFSLPENCTYMDELKEAFLLSSFAYSFFSTSLIDAEIFDIKTIALKSNLFNGKIDLNIYKIFTTVEEI